MGILEIIAIIIIAMVIPLITDILFDKETKDNSEENKEGKINE